MPTAVSRALAVTVGASLLILLALGGQALAAKSTKKVNATATLTSLVNQTKNLPKLAASKNAKAKLLRTARSAKAARSRPCTALTRLAAYRKTLRATKIRPTAKGTKNKARLRAKLAALGPAALKASRKLLADRRAKRCGGGVIPSTLPMAKSTVLSSDENGMTLRVELPELKFAPQTGGGKSWTQLVLPDTDTPAADGTPGIPVVSSQLRRAGRREGQGRAGQRRVVHDRRRRRVPGSARGARPDQPIPGPPTADPNNPRSPTSSRARSRAPPFTIDRAPTRTTRSSRRRRHRARSSASRATSRSAACRSRPRSTTPPTTGLKVINTVDVKATFEGGTKTFSARAQLAVGALAADVRREPPQPRRVVSKLDFIMRRCGEEMLVITNPATQAAADRSRSASARRAGARTSSRSARGRARSARPRRRSRRSSAAA